MGQVHTWPLDLRLNFSTPTRRKRRSCLVYYSSQVYIFYLFHLQIKQKNIEESDGKRRKERERVKGKKNIEKQEKEARENTDKL